MNHAPAVWVMTEGRAHRVRKKRGGILSVAALLCVMAAAEVLFLNFVAGPDTVALMMAAEGVATTD
jgi:hypothetical protein